MPVVGCALFGQGCPPLIDVNICTATSFLQPPTMTKDNQVVVLSIAGSDSVCGAGIQVSGLRWFIDIGGLEA